MACRQGLVAEMIEPQLLRAKSPSSTVVVSLVELSVTLISQQSSSFILRPEG
jgi:hypothetical protein